MSKSIFLKITAFLFLFAIFFVVPYSAFAANVYYSVGQNATDHKTGSPTVTISSGTATFSVAQTSIYMGVGDRVTYNGSTVAYISGKTSTTVWTLVTATGGTPADVTAQTVNSIAHEYTSLSAAEAGASDANHLNTSDLVTGNYVLNIPCYYDSAADTTAVTVNGWTTGASNYIKIYTPNNTSTEVNLSQRHSGKWDTGKYRLEVTNDTGINGSEEYVRIDGLQIKIISVNSNADSAIYFGGTDNSSSKIIISNNILTGSYSGTSSDSAGIDAGVGFNFHIHNNIIYDFINGINSFRGGIRGYDSLAIIYAYNNTVYNCDNGINRLSSTMHLKNNIAYNNTNNYGTGFDASSTNNLSGPSQTDAPGSSPQNAKTVSFADVANKDFHLSPTDTAAKNAGTDLSADANLAFSTDIEGHSRPNSTAWDIGAHEAANAIYYSVGQNTTDHKTGTPNVTITSGVATFDVAQTATNMGVGDRLTAGGNAYYIASKTSTTVWNVVDKLGAIPADLPSTAVTSIAHEYASLSAAEAGAADANHLNTSDLVAGNYILNIPCYYDTGADTTTAAISGWTTGASNYIKIYTPNNTSTEVNLSQRHSGKWDTGKYRLEVAASAAIRLYENVRVIGLQISSVTSAGVYAIADSVSEQHISDNIIKGGSGVANYVHAIFMAVAAAATTVKVYNNIIYGYTGLEGSGVYNSDSFVTAYVYNNTIVNNTAGIRANAGTTKAVNNIVYGSGNTSAYAGTFFDAGTNYNATDGTDTTGQGANSKTGQAFSFADTANKDFHLSPSDVAAKNAGTDLSADANLAFSTDIDGQTRDNLWDIGADESLASAFRTKGFLKTTGNVKFGN